MDVSGPYEKRLSPGAAEERNIRRVGNNGRGETIELLEAHRRDAKDLFQKRAVGNDRGK
ncbi:MAG: hypothetical protein WBC04_05795 [Candidatus Acidiferrales bacterium]